VFFLGQDEAVANTWLIRCSEGGSAVDACVSNDVVAVRFLAVGDVTQLTENEVADAIRTMPDRSDHNRLTGELLAFAHEVKVGDVVLTPDKSRSRYFLGVVSDDYTWNENSPVPEMRHLRPTNWISYLDWDEVPLEFKSIKYYQRTVLQVQDPTVERACSEAMTRELSKTDLLRASSTRKTASPRPRKAAAAKATKPAPAPTDRVCEGCHLRKPFSQFPNGAGLCVDCE
jgi:predicted Mrr-cat superfamily restriction endonuclease